MKIFDGVVMKPTLSPTVQTVLSLVGLLANSFAEAKECMKKRQAEEANGGGTTLDQVMQQAGTEIPGLEEALARLMGGGEEARQAATLIAGTPDPITLLNNFAAHYGFGVTTGKQPIVTPPPKAKARPARVGGSPAAAASATVDTTSGVVPLKFRPEFAREGRDGATADAPSSGPAKFRPEFAREGREAAQTTAANSPPPATLVSPAPPPAASQAQVQPPLDTVEALLEELRRQDDAHAAMIDARLQRAESRLAALEEKARALGMDQPEAAPAVPTPTEPAVAVDAGSEISKGDAAVATTVVPEVPLAASAAEAPVGEPATVAPSVPASTGQPLPSPSEEARARDAKLIAAYVQASAERKQKQAARLAAIEDRMEVVDAICDREQARRAAPLHA
jgi:hypothetical protein